MSSKWKRNVAIYYYRRDLPEGISFEHSVAVDTETMGLVPRRDRLCVVQLADGDSNCHIVHLDRDYNCPNLKRTLSHSSLVKIFHFARFDLATIKYHLNVMSTPVYCTKIASRLARTTARRHGLKDLCYDLLGLEISKQQQLSDWGDAGLTQEQIEYAAADVMYLHSIRSRLDYLLERESRKELAEACFHFLPYRVILDLDGWEENDLFSH